MIKKIIRTASIFLLFGAAGILFLKNFTISFAHSFSPSLHSKTGELLDARVSPDEQWRFEPVSHLPEQYIQSVLVYEDKNFFLHKGVDPLALFRAIVQNILAYQVKSGASTLTMQTVRLSQGTTKRTVRQKLKEILLAAILEIRCSKKQILQLYAAHAPYGGNTVGLTAASYRYFLRPPQNLSTAELATLAVLPNQPSLVRPGIQNDQLKKKRNSVLRALHTQALISETDYTLACSERLPEKPLPIIHHAPHYLTYKLKNNNTNSSVHFTSTLNYHLQKRVGEILEHHSAMLSKNQIYNAAALIIENQSGNITAYIGNTGLSRNDGKNQNVDIIQSKRSSGSLLKPFLYAAALDAGLILPDTFLEDIPVRIGNYIPQNNTHVFSGVVPASQALSQSLNVPFVNLLQDFTIPAFLKILSDSGFTTFTRTADDYGLPLILGGGELTLFEAVYAYRNLMLCAQEKCNSPEVYPLSSAACILTLNALTMGIRPKEEALWQHYAKQKKIAWKTGTSYGNRDAWTIGVTADYTIGVWIGNANGTGRPGIISSLTAAPILFELFSLLNTKLWPLDISTKAETVKTCIHSGFPASIYCNNTTHTYKPFNAPLLRMCPFCKPVFLTPDKKHQVLADTAKTLPIIEYRFVLPPRLEYFYKQSHADYNTLPPYLPNTHKQANKEFEILFPKEYEQIIIPIELGGTQGAMLAEAVHRDSKSVIFWDLDGTYLGKTHGIHQWKIQANPGIHVLTLTDNNGIRRTCHFTVLKKVP